MVNSEIITHSQQETEQWAARFAQALQPNSVVALVGDLGSGKTVIAKGIGRGLGVREEVISPTFNYVLEYRGRLQLFHADLFRIERAESFVGLGFEEYFDRGGVFLIEWADRVRALLPPDAILIDIVPGSSPDERRITVQHGP